MQQHISTAVMALRPRDQIHDCSSSSMQLRRTSFRAPTNGVCITKIRGHANGRAFMAGRDGNLYELTYSVQQALTFASLGFGDPKVIKKCERYVAVAFVI